MIKKYFGPFSKGPYRTHMLIKRKWAFKMNRCEENE